MCAVREVSCICLFGRSGATTLEGTVKIAQHLAHTVSMVVPQVLEETGFDLTPYFPPAQLHPSYVEPEGTERVPYYVELVIREQKIRLYFVPGVSEHTRFETRTRKEISVRGPPLSALTGECPSGRSLASLSTTCGPPNLTGAFPAENRLVQPFRLTDMEQRGDERQRRRGRQEGQRIDARQDGALERQAGKVLHGDAVHLVRWCPSPP